MKKRQVRCYLRSMGIAKKVKWIIIEHNDDYQQKHKEALAALTHIELEFARLRDK